MSDEQKGEAHGQGGRVNTAPMTRLTDTQPGAPAPPPALALGHGLPPAPQTPPSVDELLEALSYPRPPVTPPPPAAMPAAAVPVAAPAAAVPHESAGQAYAAAHVGPHAVPARIVSAPPPAAVELSRSVNASAEAWAAAQRREAETLAAPAQRGSVAPSNGASGRPSGLGTPPPAVPDELDDDLKTDPALAVIHRRRKVQGLVFGFLGGGLLAVLLAWVFRPGAPPQDEGSFAAAPPAEVTAQEVAPPSLPELGLEPVPPAAVEEEPPTVAVSNEGAMAPASPSAKAKGDPTKRPSRPEPAAAPLPGDKFAPAASGRPRPPYDPNMEHRF